LVDNRDGCRTQAWEQTEEKKSTSERERLNELKGEKEGLRLAPKNFNEYRPRKTEHEQQTEDEAGE